MQAFTDVNKRTARLCANIPLIHHNLFPISFNKIEKNDYISAMIAIDELNNPQILGELYTFSYLYTAKEYSVLVDSLDFNEAKIRFRKELRGILREVILKKLSKRPMKNYIEKMVREVIPDIFQTECMNIIDEEIKNMGPERIYGLGITQSELNAWQKLNK